MPRRVASVGPLLVAVVVAWSLRQVPGAHAQDDAGVWVAVSDVSAPSARYDHAAVWTGSEMLIWGGVGVGSNSGRSNLDDGGRYSPTTDTWAPISTVGAPAPRSHHVAVWTGNEMLVWGGQGNQEWLGDGAAYDPTSDSWRPLAPSPFPASNRASGIWTGTELILCCDHVNAAYNPSTDTWRSVPAEPTASGLSPRFSHTALWTGDAMVVAGGAVCPPAKCIWADFGSVYTPATDAWAPLPCLQAGESSTAVWTGQEAIFYGDTQTPLLAVPAARITLADAGCTPLSSTNAPAPRMNHTAVWDGASMLIWGGSPISAREVAGGAAYDPVTDTWHTLPAADAPSARSRHTAVWTGNEMIVWGGANGDSHNQSIGDGARYLPAGHGPTTSNNSK